MDKLTISGEGVDITAQFNPDEYSLNKGVKIEDQETTGLNGSEPQFTSGENEKLSLTLFFDTTLEGPSVTAQTEACLQLAKILPDLGRPPIVTVQWGEALCFRAVVESVQRKFSLFDRKGNPLRATVQLAFREFKTSKEFALEKEGQLSPHTRRWVVQRGDTLEGIAQETYRNPGVWRLIANSNYLADPLRLIPGTVLILPPQELPG